MVRAGSRSLPSPIDERLSKELQERFGLAVSAKVLRLRRDFGALRTGRVMSGDRRRWRYLPGTAELVAELIALEGDGLSEEEAVLVVFCRGRPVAERGVRRAYKSYLEKRRSRFEAWFLVDDPSKAANQATLTFLRTDVGRRLRHLANGLWTRARADPDTRIWPRTSWVGALLREAVSEPLAVETGRTPDQVGAMLSLLLEANNRLPGRDVLETMREPSAREKLGLLTVDRLLERTQHASYEEMIEVAQELRESVEWSEGRDLVAALVALFDTSPTPAQTVEDKMLATIGVPALLLAHEHARSGGGI